MTARSLIPRRKLFDNPTFLGAQISPDGRWISWLAPVDGVLNVWVAAAGDVSQGRPVTRTKGRPINWHMWSQDGRYLLFLNDETGDENHHMFAVDHASEALRDLTPYGKVSTQINTWSLDRPGEIAVRLNDRDERFHDVHVIDLASGRRTLVWENRQEFEYVGLDWHYRPRFARSARPGGGMQLWRIEDGQPQPWQAVPYEDALTTEAHIFNRAGTHLFMSSSVGRETAALQRVDWTTGEATIVAEHPRSDLAGAIWDAKTLEPVAVGFRGTHKRWQPIGQAITADLALIARELPGFEFDVAGQSHDDRRWIVTAHKAEQPATYYLLDRDRQSLTEMFRARPELKPYRLAPMHAIETKSRDGLELVSYLTLPAEETGMRPRSPLPMVLVVHGGPWGRDAYGYRGDHQWLADRGYAVLSVNYRGSTGFGKSFVAAAEKQHAAKMHEDLIDMVEWAIGEGIADRSKVAIFGGSYGGYASFVGATFTPHVFCCAVPVVGITNLQTMLESIPPYWAAFAEFMYRSYGDPRTEEGRALLAERSPLHKVDRIARPMLIFHGANDVRCKVAESDSIVAAMQAKGIPVTYVVYPDEGHGFHKPGNRLSYIAIAEAFFARHLGGACEPMGKDLEGSSHEIRAGADILADLGVA